LGAEDQRKPTCTIIGGPNGSGKSTIYDHLGLPGRFVNADIIARGGHDIPEDVIRRRYEAALKQLPEAIRAADGSMLLDNSLSSGPHLLPRIHGAAIEVNNLDEANIFHCRLAEVVSDALAITTYAVFRASKPE